VQDFAVASARASSGWHTEKNQAHRAQVPAYDLASIQVTNDVVDEGALKNGLCHPAAAPCDDEAGHGAGTLSFIA
jgi:hypothetical protein